MSIKFLKKNKLFYLLLFINLITIFADEQKCKVIEHCDLCPDLPKCETCSVGYTLNFEQTKCLLLVENNSRQNISYSQNQTLSSVNNSSLINQQTPALGSAKNSSLINGQKSQFGVNQNLNNINKPFSSAFDPNSKQEIPKSQKGKIFIIVVVLVVAVLVILCIRWLLSSKKKNKGGYFYDETGNQESAKVVYIR